MCPKHSTPLSRYVAIFLRGKSRRKLFEISADALAHTHSQAAGPLVKSIMKETFDSKEKRDQVNCNILKRLNALLDASEVKKKQADLRGLLEMLGHDGKTDEKVFFGAQYREVNKISDEGSLALLTGLSTNHVLRTIRITDRLPLAMHP